MLGTSQLKGEEGENAVLSALKVGYKGKITIFAIVQEQLD